MRGVIAVSAWLVAAAIASAPAFAAEPDFEVLSLAEPVSQTDTAAITSGSRDADFAPRGAPSRADVEWVKLRSAAGFRPAGLPVLVVNKTGGVRLELYQTRDGAGLHLPIAVELPDFRGARTVVYILPGGLSAGQNLYVRLEGSGGARGTVHFSGSTLEEALALGSEHARMIALAFGALLAMSLAALLIWFVLADRLFILYAAFFSLQALYVVYLSGQGFEWPWLAWARPLASHAWNVPVALSGAIACLFVREIADIRHYSPRVYAVFRWLAVAFVLLALANVGKLFGLAALVSGIGNLLFIGTAVFTLIVSFLAWRRGIRAAGWFLVAWGLLEAVTIATAVRLLMADSEHAERLLYFGLPLSMVAASVLVALGVADRLREQRTALGDAERRAQTDALTGVLNRRSLIERLEAACLRARARELPIALLFIDLDHFKQINDSYGHAAGDACLRAIIDPIQAELRQSDVIGRFGGEEFVVILSSADTAAAHPIAERIRDRVANIRIDGFRAPIQLTCSIGVAGSDTLGVWDEALIACADTAVYAAKSAGRNRVQVAPPAAA